jgi:hypothetical protein
MTLFIACILLYQFDWGWHWYPVAVIIWVLHEFQVFANISRFKRSRMQSPPARTEDPT